ncbi:MAG: SDR family oxidoreductase [Cyanobacteria bacterium P01_G01_bin.67]
MLLEEKVALVVGISNDIGRVTALSMANAGAKVAIADEDSVRGEAIVRKIKQAGGKAFFHETDITLNKQVSVLINRIVEEYGGLDIAFNNVSGEGPYIPLASQPEGLVAELINFNLNGTWMCLKYEIQQMLKQNQGTIINNVSMFKSDGKPGCSIYRSTKAAVKALTESSALEYARNNIRINAISPGILQKATRLAQGLQSEEETPLSSIMVPLGRYGEFQEVANAVIWLSSDQSSYITGQVLRIDGGINALIAN